VRFQPSLWFMRDNHLPFARTARTIGKSVRILPRESYLALLENAQGTTLFADAFALLGNKRANITEGGRLSCAYFVSAVLLIASSFAPSFGLIRALHFTVRGTREDLRACGWKPISAPRKGAVVVWEAREGHEHIGFALGGGMALSNSSTFGRVTRHPLTFGKRGTNVYRRVTELWWHPALD